VSRDHAEIALQDNHFVVRDRNSRYGTYVNGEQVAERTLAHVRRILTVVARPRPRYSRPGDDTAPRRRFGLAFESRPPPLAC